MTHRRATVTSVRLGATKVLVGYSSIYDRYGLGLVYTIRTFRYPHHSCLTLVRRRSAREMARERAKALKGERGQYEIDDALIFCLAPFFGRLTLRPLCARRACAMVASAYGEHGTPLRKILTQAGHKSFLRPRRTCQIAPFIILHLFEIIYDFTL